MYSSTEQRARMSVSIAHQTRNAMGVFYKTSCEVTVRLPNAEKQRKSSALRFLSSFVVIAFAHPSHPFREGSDVFLQLPCSDADLKNLLHMDALNHPALKETSEGSATHHFCHVFSARGGLHCCAKPLQSHYQLAHDQMITKVNTNT